jgi:hypothetical protein
LDDVNEESVSHWLEDNGDLLGLQPKPQVTQEQQIDRAALRQQDIVTQGAITPDKADEQLMRIQNATTAEEIINMIQSGEF